MKLVSYQREGSVRLGVLQGNRVVDIRRAQTHLRSRNPRHVAKFPLPDSLITFLGGGPAYRDEAARTLDAVMSDPECKDPASMRERGVAFDLADVQLKAPVQGPGKVVCLGLNYRDHAEEAGRDLPEWPTLFAKMPSTLVGSGEPILLPEMSQEVDYEAELALVIGVTCRHVAADEAFTVLAGYAAFNDVSARDVQRRTTQWFSGKSFDTFGPMGPIVTRDEVGDPQTVDIRLSLNGEIMQSSNTECMVFSIPRIVEYVSAIMTLEPGDVIATGTPGGVGFLRTPPRFLQSGDTVTVEIESVGSVTSPVQSESAVE